MNGLKIKTQELLYWTFNQDLPTIITTSFGEYSAVLLHMVYGIDPQVKTVWLDTQFNTNFTLLYKDKLCNQLDIDLITYTGEEWNDDIPIPHTIKYHHFVEQVKLTPFRQALNDLQPSFWITGIRREETEQRRQMKHINYNNGIIKIAPLLDWTSQDMENYLEEYSLPNEPRYFDPTKPDVKSECGLHTKILEGKTNNENNSTWR